MLNGYLITTVIIAIAFVLVGGVTLSRNPSSRINQLFMFFSGCLAVWLVANYFAGTSTVDYKIALPANRLTFLFAGMSTIAVLLFVKELTKTPVKKWQGYYLFFSLVAIVLGASSLVVSDIKADGGTYLINLGTLSSLYFVAVIANAVFTIQNLFKAKKNAIGTLRSQIQTIETSFAIGLGCIIITNALIPIAFGNYSLTSVGSFFSSFFVIGISYAIIKHRLFDIRLVVARSLAYLLLLSSLVGLYGLVVFGVASALFGESQFSQRVVPILTALLLAFTSPYLRQLFDRFTNRLFYRDSYEPQVFLDEFNKQLVTNNDLEALLKKCSETIVNNIKAEFALFALKETAYSKQRLIGNQNKSLGIEEVSFVRSVASQSNKIVIVADDLEDVDELRQKMQQYDVALLARLATDPNREAEGLGYLILGQKMSGNPYTKKDINIIEIVANELVIAVQNALRFEEIEKFNATLQEKIDDATKQLQKTNDKLQALDETKDEFISMASHQLRTPLTSVKGYLSMVLEGDTGEITEMQRKLLDQAFTSSQRMVYLIADLLNVSRLRTGKFLIEPIATNLADVVESEVHQLAETAKGRGLTLAYDKPADFPTLMLDETKIRQVMMNFMDNAIYYAKPNGHVTVGLKETDKAIEFTVSDDGIGVPKSEQHHLFTKFYRARNAKKARPDGTGLGLFMAKKVIVAQGGAVIFKSEENKGSTFGFTFDKSKLQPSVSPTHTST